MNDKKQKMIATIVKENRLRANYTQQELSDKTNISLRSIQRIEKGDVLPRMHTLKVLADALNFSLDLLTATPHVADSENEAPEFVVDKKDNVRKWIYSVAIAVISMLLSAAFVAQSSSFPETDFETFMFSAAVVGIVTFLLLLVWKKPNTRHQDLTSKE